VHQQRVVDVDPERELLLVSEISQLRVDQQLRQNPANIRSFTSAANAKLDEQRSTKRNADGWW
jgi:hypothetical protein